MKDVGGSYRCPGIISTVAVKGAVENSKEFLAIKGGSGIQQ